MIPRRPGPWTTLAVVAVVLAGLALCNWQYERGRAKSELSSRIATLAQGAPVVMPAAEIRPEDYAWRRVELRGEFLSEATVFIDNRVHRGIAGYHVVMPLKIAGSNRCVLVNRGWMAATGDRKAPQVPKTPPGIVSVIGVAILPPEHHFELSTRVAEGNVWQNLTLERYRAAVNLPIQPLVVQQENDLGDGLERAWSLPDSGAAKNYAYAVQWFLLSVAALILFVVAHVRKKSER